MHRYFLLFCLTTTAFAVPATNEEKTCRIGLRHIESQGIGYEEGYTTLEGFFSPDPSQWTVVPFLDARTHVSDNGRWAANAGLGFRTIAGCRIYGMNGYYDYRNAQRMHAHQIGLGLETLGQLFDFRLNGYLPVGKKVSAPWDPAFGAFSGHQMLVSQKHQFAMKGADAEFGFHVGTWRDFDFYTAAGPYYFRGDLGSNVWGGKARVSGMYKDFVGVELSNSYDATFHNRFQGQISLNFSFGSNAQKTCAGRMAQAVHRQEIIVMDTQRKNTVAIDPATGLPFFFVFVDNTSSSNGTYDNPYHTLAQAEANSSPGDVIYVFPGDGTTRGMDGGITLKTNQKFWGSGVSHEIQTTAGTISIPAQSSSLPTITNTDTNTAGDAVTLATNNAISGFTITSALHDAIFGTDPQSVDVSFCTFTNNATFAIEASFSGNAAISVTNNRFSSNFNGISLNLHGTSNIVCSGNTFENQTPSSSEAPIEITATSNVLTANIENNVFNHNPSGSILFSFNTVVDANISVLNNTFTNNSTGSHTNLRSSFVIVPTGTTNNCSLAFTGNTFSGNTGSANNSIYLHTSGAFTTLAVTTSGNTMSNNTGAAINLATPVLNSLTLSATDNILSGLGDNGIAVIASGTTSTGNITINNNTITDIGNTSDGIAVNQDFSTLDLTVLNNVIDACENTGIISFAPTGINSLTVNISNNAISNCQNLGSNAAAGIDIEQFASLAGSVTNNTLSGNTGLSTAIGSTLAMPTACLTLSGNNSTTNYLVSNPMDGIFNLTPCDVDSANVGTIIHAGTIDAVQSCPGAVPCPP